MAYARPRLGWEAGLDAVSDARRQPQIPTPVIVRALTVMFLAFYRRDLKPAARQVASRLHVARQVAGELYASPLAAAPRAPPGRKPPPLVVPVA